MQTKQAACVLFSKKFDFQRREGAVRIWKCPRFGRCGFGSRALGVSRIFCRGLGYSLNVPLANGITDSTYWALFKPVMAKVMEVYRPEAIVFQSGEFILLRSRTPDKDLPFHNYQLLYVLFQLCLADPPLPAKDLRFTVMYSTSTLACAMSRGRSGL